MKRLLTTLLCLSLFAGLYAQTEVDKAGSTIKGLLKKKPKTTSQTAQATDNTQQPVNNQSTEKAAATVLRKRPNRPAPKRMQTMILYPAIRYCLRMTLPMTRMANFPRTGI